MTLRCHLHGVEPGACFSLHHSPFANRLGYDPTSEAARIHEALRAQRLRSAWGSERTHECDDNGVLCRVCDAELLERYDAETDITFAAHPRSRRRIVGRVVPLNGAVEAATQGEEG